MLETSLKNFKNEERKMTDVLKLAAVDGIDKMDSRTFEAIQAVFGFMRASTDLIDEQTKAIDEINKKLDKLMKRKS